MIHKICPICNSKLSEILPTSNDKKVEHKVYICDDEIDHKFWVSEYESDCLRWNPGANFEDTLYFRKFKSTNRDLIKDESIKALGEYLKSPEYLTGLEDREDDTEIFTLTKINQDYNNTPEYNEIFDNKVHENLLGIIQSQNLTIKQLIDEYGKLEKYTDELQDKYDNIVKNKNVSPSGIILKV